MIQKRILVPDRVRRLPRTDWNLIAYDAPLTQVLALPSLKATPPESKATPNNYQQLLAILAASTSVKEST